MNEIKDFQQVRRASGLTSREVATLAEVPLREEYLFEIGGPTSPETRRKIIQAFSRLTGHAYTIADFESDVPPPQQAHRSERPSSQQTQGGRSRGHKHLHQ